MPAQSVELDISQTGAYKKVGREKINLSNNFLETFNHLCANGVQATSPSSSLFLKEKKIYHNMVYQTAFKFKPGITLKSLQVYEDEKSNFNKS